MRRFAAMVGMLVALVVVPGVAGATPIGVNGCAIDPNTGVNACDIYADFNVNGSSDLGPAEGNLGGYLPGYVLLLNAQADLSTFEASDVAHILVIQDSLFQLFSNTAADFQFGDVFKTAIGSGGSVDQIAGCPPIPSGVPQLDGVGYCTNADLVTLDQSVAWADGFGGGGNDTVRIHTALSESPLQPVPEPGTLTLFGLGSALAALRRRRAAQRASTDA